ncbi:2-phospho-L-lactate guanylyltransferase [Natronomonas salsuginis]|jgi:2-phospho-L-lactate guanylyltransferase|uniref:2-phospho-L-lactate guanylyltransferase n=1 Tax=Natronomonas salsuginis TaxID=2217661 RepID=A0A4U5JFB8_9EURY|nr:2-phospho-L-lactate guanylyltransferase [Natronomonas salsuginis]TKR28072.1 2-phospho-L-lactate guanylyltransferase [Natronomonas salsuginis]
MDALVPFAAREPKTRLATVLEPDERVEFARTMLRDVCSAIDATDASPTVLSTDPIDSEWPVVVDDRPLTAAVNDRLDPPVAVVMADLALATPDALSRLFGAEGEVVIAPGLGGGTNALVVREPDFHTDYHGASVADHRRIASEVGVEATAVDSFRLAVDIDEPEDLAELLLHGSGESVEWLRSAGFELSTPDGRVTVRRQAR